MTTEERFWRECRSRLEHNAVVTKATAPVSPDGIKDIFGDTHRSGLADPAQTLFFVDQEPRANWGHPCAYVFVTEDQVVWVDAEWPPTSKVAFESVREVATFPTNAYQIVAFVNEVGTGGLTPSQMEAYLASREVIAEDDFLFGVYGMEAGDTEGDYEDA